MSKIVQAGEFFVVGGPVQPDRPCYIERAADQELEQGISDQRFCYVLAARATGKSSLMARTIKVLRGEGQLAAVVDLNQLGVRGESTDAGRWYYSIAYRILRELRLKTDLQSWWQEKSALMSEQRLAEFFWEIVLAETAVPVTVFFDSIERALDMPFAQELYSAIRACYTRRATEPDFARLNFVVLGAAAHTQLCRDVSISPFPEGHAIELTDFTHEETQRLAPGLPVEPDVAREVMERIHDWTSGQPYLTQKVARGVARKGGRAEDVERVVRERFLTSNVTRDEPLLGHIRSLIAGRGPNARQALVMLDKIARGGEVYDEPESPACTLLHLSGVVSTGPGGRLHYRNKVYRTVFNSRWTGAALPFNWKTAAVAAVVAAALVLVPLWYTQYLPRQYFDTLSVTESYAEAEDAHRKLRRLPGFARTADDLLADAITRRARAATTFNEIEAAMTVLGRLPEREALADQLMSEFWLERSRQRAAAERRDAALLFALEGLSGQSVEARLALAELIGDDYRHLERSFRLTAVPAHWSVDWQRETLTLVDRGRRAQRWPLHPSDVDAQGDALPDGPTRLAALEHVPLRRELSVDRPGRAGAFVLLLSLRHSSAADLHVTLEAPSGARATLPLPWQGDDTLSYSLHAGSDTALAPLAEEGRQGVWRLTLVDRRAGSRGSLMSWGLRFEGDEHVVWDEPEQGIAIPDPRRTDDVELTFDERGRVAAARAVGPGTTGALALWDLVSGRRKGDLQTPAAVDHVAFTADGSRLVTVAGNTLTLWDVERTEALARITTEAGFALPPALGADGGYIAFAERDPAGGAPRLGLLRSDSGELVATIDAPAGVADWLLGAQARFLALLGPSRVIRILEPRRGEVVRELRHERDVERMLVAPEDDILVTVDAGGDVHAWRVEGGADPSGGPGARAQRLGVTVDPLSVSLAANGSVVAFQTPQGYVVARHPDGRREPQRFRMDRSTGLPVRTRVSADGRRLLTDTGVLLRLWRLEGGRQYQDIDLSALTLDRQGRIAALGFRGGHVRVRSASELERWSGAASVVDFIGHRGAVTALAISTEHSMIVSGGLDGAVRVWDLASVAPAPHFMRHPAGPVHAVAVSGDGLRLVSGAEYSARIWDAADGEQIGEIPVNGAALAVDIAPDSSLLAVGDSAGNVYIAALNGAASPRSTRAQSSVRALAFAPRGPLLASGDDAGHVQLWNALTAEPVGESHAFPHPVRWLRFSEDAEFLVVQTDHWIHRLAVDGESLHVVNSRLPAAGLESGAAFAAPRGESLRLVGGLGVGQPMFHELDLTGPSFPPLREDSELLKRDWPYLLGLGLGPRGNEGPLYP
jgi:WD40 repeat protein/subtilisin-like proprotein convertase family protein